MLYEVKNKIREDKKKKEDLKALSSVAETNSQVKSQVTQGIDLKVDVETLKQMTNEYSSD